MSIQHNAHAVAGKLLGAAAHIEGEVHGQMASLAQRIAATMRQRAPKFRTTLAQSIRHDENARFDFVIRPHTDYADDVERGRKPGKHLPRFFDPASASIVAWLESRISSHARRLNPKFRPGKLGSARRTAAELELRDRYMALSWHVKHHGLKAHPYVKPTADEWRPRVPPELTLAVRRGLQLARFGGSA